MERDLPWRVLELPESGAASASPGPEPTGPPSRDVRRLVALAALGVSALGALAIAVILVLAGPREGTLVLAGTAGRAPGPAAAGGSLAPDTALVAGSGLVIDVAGAVLHPGVYRLLAGSRVADAIAAAGGFGPRVDAIAAQELNLAAPLTDGAQVRVPSRDDAAGRGASPSDAGGGASGGPVDLNTATAAQLDSLPGIGPVTVAKIIASRQEQPFSAVGDLQARKLVGAATFAKLAGLVTVGGR